MSFLDKKIKIIIIGASGYTGAELLRILVNHKNAEIISLIAEKNAGKDISELYPSLRSYNLPKMISLKEVDLSKADLVFCCLPHATSQDIIKDIPKKVKVIDLSADFRLFDTNVYEKWYGTEHKAKDLQKQAVYGLTELYRDPIKSARLVACPGCYPTGSTLALVPLLRRNLIDANPIIIDAKSGITGAGRSLTESNLFAEVNEGARAYKICNHRHMPEIEQTLAAASANKVSVVFTPQIIPTSRGILSTIYIKLAKDIKVQDIHDTLHDRYENEHFVEVLPMGALPSTRDVNGTNKCIIAVSKSSTPDMAIIVSAIDNLCKGSSGQAVQNMNVMFGLDETTGLEFAPVFP